MNSLLEDITIAFEIAKTNIKTGVEGTYLGIIWYLLDPLFFFMIIIFVRSFIRGSNFAQYPLYLITGLIIFHYFSKTTSKMVFFAKNSNSYFKRSNLSHNCLFLGSFFQGVYLQLFEILILIFFVIIFKGSLIGVLIYFFIVLFFFSCLIIGISFFISVVGAFFPDFSKVWHLLMRLFRFVLPIFFIFEENSLIYQINLFNPVFYFLQITRDLILYNKISSPFFLIIAFFSSMFFLIIGYLVFKKYNKFFSELVE